MQHWMEYVKASYEIVLHGEERAGINLDHDIEAFVVHTFARYMSQPNIPTEAIAIKMLNAANEIGEIKKRHLQEIAEECILIDGLELNSRRWPSKKYFYDMGKLALENRAWVERPPELFYESVAYNLAKISTILHKIKDNV